MVCIFCIKETWIKNILGVSFVGTIFPGSLSITLCGLRHRPGVRAVRLNQYYCQRLFRAQGYFRHRFWKNKQKQTGTSFKPADAQEAYFLEQHIRKYKSIIRINSLKNNFNVFLLPFDDVGYL